MDAKYSYRNLEVYKTGKRLVKEVYVLLKKFPKEEQYALCDQLRRASVSVPSNIAEGLNRFSDKEKLHFIEFAYASLMETQCQLDIACDLRYISGEEFEGINRIIDEEARLLSGLRNRYFTTPQDSSTPQNFSTPQNSATLQNSSTL